MRVRYYFSTFSAEQQGLIVHRSGTDFGVYYRDSGTMIAEAWPEGVHYYTTNEDNGNLPDARLQAAVSFMSIQTYVDAHLVIGDYNDHDWEARLSRQGERTVVNLKVTGNDTKKAKGICQKLINGQLLPSYTVKDQVLTSEQVATIVYGNGDREHFLSVVQGAQDAMTRTFEHIKVIQAQMAALVAKNAELEALVTSQGK